MKKTIVILFALLILLTGCGSKTDPEETLSAFLTDIEPTRMGVYVTGDKKDLSEIKEYIFVCQDEFARGQDAAMQYLKDINRWNELNLDKKATAYQALADFAENSENKALIFNEAYIDALKGDEKLKEYVNEFQLIWEYDEVSAYDFSLADNPFQVYIIGSDDRAHEINEYSRYDADMVLTVNPVTKQVLIVSIPRDAHVKNIAYDGQLDKLNLTGISGLDVALAAVNDKFNQNISLYIMTNFDGFIEMIDEMGGIDVYNPYRFSTVHGHNEVVNYTFNEGEIHLNGSKALAFGRERQTLYEYAGAPVGKYNGDMARNRHHLILMKGIIDKMISLESVLNYKTLMEKIQDCFHTNISPSQMYALALMQFIEKPEWNIVTQYVYADYVSDIAVTWADLGLLTCGKLDDNDVSYVSDLMNKVMAGEIISQEPIPSESY